MKTRLWIMLAAFVLIFFSCKKEEDGNLDQIIPDALFGTWINNIEDPWAGITTEYYLLTITKVDTKNGLYQMDWVADYSEENFLLVLEASKGTFYVLNNVIYLTATHFGTEIALDDVTIYDTTVWWGQSDPEFSNFEQEDYMVAFEISGNLLMLTTDGNKDGDFSDSEDETVTFTRVD